VNKSAQLVAVYADGERSSTEIAKLVGLSPRYVRRLMLRHNMPRLKEGAQHAENNHQYRAGRSVDLDGYVLALAPEDHPLLRKRNNRKGGTYVYEHRLVMEKKLGRYLHKDEVVDHADGLTLHNTPENLRLFQSNADHLRETTAGTPRRWSQEGLSNIGARTDRGRKIRRVDMYRRRREAGEIRLRQILLAALKLGTDSPHLWGTLHHLEPFQIDPSSRSSLERALVGLYEKWGVGHTL
jgi:hypothetical protein